MAKKETATLNSRTNEAAEAAPPVSAPSAAPRTSTAPKEVNTSGFYCYIGPGILGLIRHGDIFPGTRADALKAAAAAIEKQPLVKTLIVSGDELSAARVRVKTPGNALYANNKKIAAGGRR